jgi:hypothetical protein
MTHDFRWAPSQIRHIVNDFWLIVAQRDWKKLSLICCLRGRSGITPISSSRLWRAQLSREQKPYRAEELARAHVLSGMDAEIAMHRVA